MGLKVELKNTVFGLIGLALGLAFGIGLCIVAALLGYSHVARWLGTSQTSAAVTAPKAPAKPVLNEELLKRQRATAAQVGELDWLKKRTGIDCSVAVSEAECLPFLSMVSGEDDIIAKVRELHDGGVKVLVSKRSAYQQLEGAEGKPLPVGELSEDGTMVFLCREATMAEVRQFLFR